jgi:F0F1-type ATP synthase assembly protein I
MAQRQETDHGSRDNTGAMLSMAVLMMAMCVGMVLAISVASAIGGGPIAWTLAVLVIVGLAAAHLKFMNHGGH